MEKQLIEKMTQKGINPCVSFVVAGLDYGVEKKIKEAVALVFGLAVKKVQVESDNEQVILDRLPKDDREITLGQANQLTDIIEDLVHQMVKKTFEDAKLSKNQENQETTQKIKIEKAKVVKAPGEDGIQKSDFFVEVTLIVRNRPEKMCFYSHPKFDNVPGFTQLICNAEEGFSRIPEINCEIAHKIGELAKVQEIYNDFISRKRFFKELNK